MRMSEEQIVDLMNTNLVGHMLFTKVTLRSARAERLTAAAGDRQGDDEASGARVNRQHRQRKEAGLLHPMRLPQVVGSHGNVGQAAYSASKVPRLLCNASP